MDNKFERWDATDPPESRCVYQSVNGPCPYKKDSVGDYCPRHASNKVAIRTNDDVQRNYRLQRWQKRVEEFTDSDQVKNLREEIGILRVIMEETLNKCQDSTDLLLYSHRLSDLAMKIERLVVSCTKLETNMNLYINKRSLIELAGRFINIINTHVTDSEALENIGNEMIESVRLLENVVE